MQRKISMDLQFCLSEEHFFSLDILVLKLVELFEAKAFAQILLLVLMLLQEVLVMRLLKGRGIDCRCGGNHWRLNGDFNRRIRTRLGAVELPIRRVSCRVCVRADALAAPTSAEAGPIPDQDQRTGEAGRRDGGRDKLPAGRRPAVEGSLRLHAQPDRPRIGMLTGCDEIVLPH